MLQRIRQRVPNILLKLYGRILMQEYSKIEHKDILEVHRKLGCEAEYLKAKVESLNQKIVMLKEVIDKINEKTNS